MKLSNLFFVTAALASLALTGCASGRYKERQAEREKVAASSGMFCEFLNGDANPDVEVEMNFQMAKRCDNSKPFSISQYKNASEVHGMIYCCSMKADAMKSDKSANGLPQKAMIPLGAKPADVKMPAPPAKPAEKVKKEETKDEEADIIE